MLNASALCGQTVRLAYEIMNIVGKPDLIFAERNLYFQKKLFLLPENFSAKKVRPKAGLVLVWQCFSCFPQCIEYERFNVILSTRQTIPSECLETIRLPICLAHEVLG